MVDTNYMFTLQMFQIMLWKILHLINVHLSVEQVCIESVDSWQKVDDILCWCALIVAGVEHEV